MTTPSLKAVAGYELMKTLRGPRPAARVQAAAQVGSSTASIKRVEQLAAQAPDLLAEVVAGKIPLTTAINGWRVRHPERVRHTVHKAEPLVWGEAQEAFMLAVNILQIRDKERAAAAKYVSGVKPADMLDTLQRWRDWESGSFTKLFETTAVMEPLIVGDHAGFHKQLDEFRNIVRLVQQHWGRASASTQTTTENRAAGLIVALQSLKGNHHEKTSASLHVVR